jgi:hypothetical protein
MRLLTDPNSLEQVLQDSHLGNKWDIDHAHSSEVMAVWLMEHSHRHALVTLVNDRHVY